MKRPATRKILFTNKAEGGYTIVTVHANRTKSALAQLFRNIIGTEEIGFGEQFCEIKNCIPKEYRTWKHSLHSNIYQTLLEYTTDHRPETIPGNVFHVISVENVAQYDEKEFARRGNIMTTLDIDDDFTAHTMTDNDWETHLDESKCVA